MNAQSHALQRIGPRQCVFNGQLSSHKQYETHRGFPAPVDIGPNRKSVLKERGLANGSFAYIVLTECVVVYERA